MANLSVRGLDETVLSNLKLRAGKDAVSVNSLVVRLLSEATLGGKAGRSVVEFHDLDDLAGTWSSRDQREFDRATKAFGEVDADLWKAGR